MTSALEEAVASVAVRIDDVQEFRAQAAAVAQALGPAVIGELCTRFHSPPHTEPPGFGPEQRGLGGWLSAWLFAIFEHMIDLECADLLVHRQVAFGPYNWIQ